VIIVTNAVKQFITWNLKDEFLPCEASALFLQVMVLLMSFKVSTTNIVVRKLPMIGTAKLFNKSHLSLPFMSLTEDRDDHSTS
jgi:hypothetical protein